MKRRVHILIQWTMALVLCLVTTGCWDRMELNDRALIVASGVDWISSGKVRLTEQVVIPHTLADSQGGVQQTFTTVSGEGKDILDAAQKLQTKLSRRIFLGHRRNIFIGEDLARHGLSGIMDEFTRNPDVRLRSDVFVVRGATANDALQIQSRTEKYPALAITKSRRNVGGTTGTTLVTFLASTASETSCVTLPVMEIGEEDVSTKRPVLDFTGRAIFNRQLKLVGYLNFSDANLRLWMANDLKIRQQTFQVKGTSDTATVDLSHFRGSVAIPRWQANVPHYAVRLSATGILRENNSRVQFTSPNAVRLMEQSVDEDIQRRVLRMILRVQRDCGTDIFGFDQALARKYPHAWKSLKRDWSSVFPDVPVVVKVDIKIRNVGASSQDPARVQSDNAW